jgi:mannosyltransferase OCH1-like enzyme
MDERYHAAPTFAQKADILRYELLYAYGGIYADCDVECLKTFDSFLPNSAFAGWESRDCVCNAVIGSEPKAHFLLEVKEEVKRRWRGGTDIIYETATGMFTEVAVRMGIKLFPPEYFYPFHYSEPHRAAEQFPNAFAVHYWMKSWGAANEGTNPKYDSAR